MDVCVCVSWVSIHKRSDVIKSKTQNDTGVEEGEKNEGAEQN